MRPELPTWRATLLGRTMTWADQLPALIGAMERLYQDAKACGLDLSEIRRAGMHLAQANNEIRSAALRLDPPQPSSGPQLTLIAAGGVDA